MGQQVPTANQKFKQNGQTQDADGMQGMSVFQMIQSKAISEQ